MTDKNDGGPVHPCTTLSKNGMPNGESMGMSLRDYFAAKAMAAALVNASAPEDKQAELQERVAELAYQFADAMLKERNK